MEAILSCSSCSDEYSSEYNSLEDEGDSIEDIKGADESEDSSLEDSDEPEEEEIFVKPPGVVDEGLEDELDLKSVSNFNKEIIVVKPENRRTSHILSKFEMTEIISIRATQISQHSNCMVDITGLDDPIKMAQAELMSRRCPLILRRHVGDLKVRGEIQSYYEYFSPNEMQFSVSYNDVL